MKKMIVFFLLMVVVLLSACNNSTEQEVPSTPAAPMVPTATPSVEFIAEEKPVRVTVKAILGESDFPSRILNELPAYVYMGTEKVNGEWTFISTSADLTGLAGLPEILAIKADTTFEPAYLNDCRNVRHGDSTRPGPRCTELELHRGKVEYFPIFEHCTYEEQILECEYTHSDRFSEDSTLYVRYDMLREEVYILLDVSVTTVKMLQELDELFKWGGLPSVVESDVLYTIYPHYDN